jgi:hypothetical protein
MTPALRPIEFVYEKAMELSDEDRLRLADLLYASAAELTEDDWDTDEEELDRIEAAIASGEMKTYSWEEVRQRVRDKLDGKRDSLL